MRVLASVNHGNQSSHVHDAAFVWVEDVTTSHFRACVVTGGQDNGGNNTIDWFAFQGSQSGVQHGQTRFTLFTTGTKCNQVAFAQVRALFLTISFSLISFCAKYTRQTDLSLLLPYIPLECAVSSCSLA